MSDRRRIVFLGLTITSSWGNGHATTYRGLVRELARRKHDVLFLERDVPWYAPHRDLPKPPYGKTALYSTIEELKDRFAREVRQADLVVVGSYVPDGIAIGEWVCSTARGVTAFYDIDTPVTLSRVEAGDCAYLTPALMRRYDLYLSFTGGPTLGRLEREFGARRARALYCSFDPSVYHPGRRASEYDLGYMGTHSPDRQPGLERLLLEPARRSAHRYVVAGPGYDVGGWPPNVRQIEHVPASAHRAFYTSLRFTLNLTRADMIRAGYSPSVRLFEAAACGVAIISDAWRGLETLFRPGSEILISASSTQTLRILDEVGDRERAAIARRARRRVLAEHTAEHRAAQLEAYLDEARRVSRVAMDPTASAGAAPAASP
jgi:spore maturation protein CgeB